jgi:hypothetical protein
MFVLDPLQPGRIPRISREGEYVSPMLGFDKSLYRISLKNQTLKQILKRIATEFYFLVFPVFKPG